VVLLLKPMLIIDMSNGFLLEPLLILLQKPEFQIHSYSKITYIKIHI
jgi:hypothetical protein